MLIRSQDKNMPKDRTMILPEYETDIICYTGKSEIPIGRYDNEEKAIKVINVIENQYLDCCCNLFQMPQNDELV